MKAWTTGNVAGTGTFRCTDCDYPVSLEAVDELPTCPNCGGKEFVRASLFTTAQNSLVDVSPEVEDRAWLEELRPPSMSPANTSPIAPAMKRSSYSRSSANGPGSAAASPLTSDSTIQRYPAVTL